MFRRIVVLLGGLLVLFHAWLFASQLWQGQLGAGPLLRWLLAGGVAAALWALYRSGASLVVGRKAVAIWVLTTLLHAPAPAGDRPGLDAPVLAEVVASLAQLTAVIGLGLGLLVLFAFLRRRHAPTLARALACGRRPVLSRRLGRSLHFAPRPPPASSVSLLV